MSFCIFIFAFSSNPASKNAEMENIAYKKLERHSSEKKEKKT